MSAKEMFKELEYKLIQNDENWVIYSFKNIFSIEFYKPHKRIQIGKELAYSHSIDIEELQAINKQISELGWNDEN